MKGYLGTVLVTLVSAITCGVTFLFALYKQLALVEVAASMLTMVELYLLSSSIGDLIEKKKEPSRLRLLVAGGIAVAVVGYYLMARSLQA